MKLYLPLILLAQISLAIPSDFLEEWGMPAKVTFAETGVTVEGRFVFAAPAKPQGRIALYFNRQLFFETGSQYSALASDVYTAIKRLLDKYSSVFLIENRKQKTAVLKTIQLTLSVQRTSLEGYKVRDIALTQVAGEFEVLSGGERRSIWRNFDSVTPFRKPARCWRTLLPWNWSKRR